MTGNEMWHGRGWWSGTRYDVVVVGAAGAGLRAAIAAHEAGAGTAIVCKSLLGKAHTVMAEGGIAAAMANRWPEDNWQVHFRDTMRGGKMLNNWRMAQLHAQEAPERVLELEEWGALFDRTEDGLILQRDFGGHRYARLGSRRRPHRPGDDPHPAAARGAAGHRRVHGVHGHRPPDRDGRPISGAFGYWRETGRSSSSRPRRCARHRRHRQVVKRTSNSWEYTGDGHALAAGRRRPDRHGVRAVPPDRHGLAAIGAGLLVTESVRGDGGISKNSRASASCSTTSRSSSGRRPPTTKRRRTAGTTTRRTTRRPRTAAARRGRRAINSEIKAGRGHPHGGVFLDIASRRARGLHPQAAADVPPVQGAGRRRHHRGADGVGPTCHYVMGGVEVDADTRQSAVPGLYAVGECSGGMHGANRLGGNSLSDLLVFGTAGEARAAYANGLGHGPASTRTRRRGRRRDCARRSSRGRREPLHDPVGPADSMNDLVGIIRTESELEQALGQIEELKLRAGGCPGRGPPRSTTPAGTWRSTSATC